MFNRVAFAAVGEWSGWVASANQRAMCKKPQKKETLTLSRDDSAIFGPSSDGEEEQQVVLALLGEERRGPVGLGNPSVAVLFPCMHVASISP